MNSALQNRKICRPQAVQKARKLKRDQPEVAEKQPQANPELPAHLKALGLEPCLRISDICLLLRVSRSKLWQMVKRGEFPQGRELSSNIRLWHPDVVRDWMKSKLITGS